MRPWPGRTRTRWPPPPSPRVGGRWLYRLWPSPAAPQKLRDGAAHRWRVEAGGAARHWSRERAGAAATTEAGRPCATSGLSARPSQRAGRPSRAVTNPCLGVGGYRLVHRQRPQTLTRPQHRSREGAERCVDPPRAPQRDACAAWCWRWCRPTRLRHALMLRTACALPPAGAVSRHRSAVQARMTAKARFPSFVDELPITQRALEFAAEQHQWQRREADHAPFILHRSRLRSCCAVATTPTLSSRPACCTT